MKNKIKDKKNKKGLTLIELLMVISIIGILASVVTVSLVGGKKKAKDSSALQAASSVAPLAYKCMLNAKGADSGRLTEPGASSLCFGATANEFPAWPDISDTGWDFENSGKFGWCNVGFSDSGHPALKEYNNGSIGGDRATGKFCFVLANSDPNRWIWCTENGCNKEGF